MERKIEKIKKEHREGYINTQRQVKIWFAQKPGCDEPFGYAVNRDRLEDFARKHPNHLTTVIIDKSRLSAEGLAKLKIYDDWNNIQIIDHEEIKNKLSDLEKELLEKVIIRELSEEQGLAVVASDVWRIFHEVLNLGMFSDFDKVSDFRNKNIPEFIKAEEWLYFWTDNNGGYNNDFLAAGYREGFSNLLLVEIQQLILKRYTAKMTGIIRDDEQHINKANITYSSVFDMRHRLGKENDKFAWDVLTRSGTGAILTAMERLHNKPYSEIPPDYNIDGILPGCIDHSVKGDMSWNPRKQEETARRQNEFSKINNAKLIIKEAIKKYCVFKQENPNVVEQYKKNLERDKLEKLTKKSLESIDKKKCLQLL